ncbi:MAG: bifunctional pantoate--beta-alanine ligase/(d)CMP kinase [Phormidesmis sp.]
MRLFNTVTELRQYLDKFEDHTIGFVPTMGALHAGHRSLIDKARSISDGVVVSIFVNPLQFAPNEDLERYPRPQQADQALCKSAGVDAVFAPSPVELYGAAQRDLSTVTQVIPPQAMMQTLCGRSRLTHFQGVATIVTKLLNIVRPTYAFFGQKDAQQVAIIKRLIRDLHLPGEVVVCPIVRESDGLALSSRNRYLSLSQRQQATVLYRSLQATQLAFEQGKRSQAALLQAAHDVLATEPAVSLDYLALVHPDTLEPLQSIDTVGMIAIAANLGTVQNSTAAQTASQTAQKGQTTRLIDNVILSDPSSERLPALSDRRAPIIAIDGPAGAGKSTVARQIAHRLGLLYLDTGAMYRALTWFVLQQGVDPSDEAAVAQLLPNCRIQLTANMKGDQPQPPRVSVNGQEITAAIRTATVTDQVSTIAAQSAVRANLVQQQQQYGTQGGIVADGRDIGTQVFPDAELKVYLTASVGERARRRYRDLQSANQPLPELDALATSIAERDRKDSTRTVSPLQKAPDAIEIITDTLTAEQVIDQVCKLYQKAIAP